MEETGQISKYMTETNYNKSGADEMTKKERKRAVADAKGGEI